ATATDTLVVLMGLGRLGDIVARLVAGGRDPGTPAAVVSRGTLPDQRVVGAALGRIPEAVAEAAVPSPALLVVGEVVRLAERIAWFDPERARAGGRVPRAGGLDRWVAGARGRRAAILALLAGTTVAARGAKATAACRRHGLPSVLTSPTERGVDLARLVVALAKPGDRVAVVV